MSDRPPPDPSPEANAGMTGSTRTLDPMELKRVLDDARRARSVPPPAAPPPAPDSDADFRDAFAESDREDAAAVERAIVAGDAREAVLRAAALVARILHVENMDQAVTALLLGIDGLSWIRFQRAARAAREGGPIDKLTATECVAFLLAAASRARASAIAPADRT